MRIALAREIHHFHATDEEINNAQTRHRAPKEIIHQHRPNGGILKQQSVGFPDPHPGKHQEKESHLKTKNDVEDVQELVHNASPQELLLS
jgi:hypothetical protein